MLGGFVWRVALISMLTICPSRYLCQRSPQLPIAGGVNGGYVMAAASQIPSWASHKKTVFLDRSDAPSDQPVLRREHQEA